MKTREDIVDGRETFPETLLKLFKGENFGKLVFKVADNGRSGVCVSAGRRAALSLER